MGLADSCCVPSSQASVPALNPEMVQRPDTLTSGSNEALPVMSPETGHRVQKWCHSESSSTEAQAKKFFRTFYSSVFGHIYLRYNF